MVQGAEEQRGLERRAKPLKQRIDAIAEVFDGLATRDQLSRELTAHPLCVEVTIVGGEKRYGVPVAAPNDAEYADTDRPAAFLKRRLEQSGRAYILTDKGAVETLIDGKVDAIALFDSAAIRAEKAAEFDARWRRMQGSALLDDPVNWYEAAKFAYRWSLDDWVVPLVEEALKRKENLVLAVQEDLALDYLAKVVESLDKEDRPAPVVGLAKCANIFPKTTATKQAAALYNGDDAALAAANEEDEKDQPVIAAAPPKPAPASKPQPKPVVAAVTKPAQPTAKPQTAAIRAAKPAVKPSAGQTLDQLIANLLINFMPMAGPLTKKAQSLKPGHPGKRRDLRPSAKFVRPSEKNVSAARCGQHGFESQGGAAWLHEVHAFLKTPRAGY